VRTNGGVVDKTAESALLKEQLASALPHYNTVLYMSNGGVSSQFQAIIGTHGIHRPRRRRQRRC
jgi:hypothetical protein